MFVFPLEIQDIITETFPGCSRKWKPYLLPPVLIVGKITRSFSRKTAEKNEAKEKRRRRRKGGGGVERMVKNDWT